MRMAIATFLLAAAAAVAAGAAEDKSATVPIHAFIDGFDKGDMKAALATFASGDIAIIDEAAPFHWFGPTAPAAWAADLAKSDAAEGRTEGNVKLGAPTRNEVSGGTAYVVVPAHYTFKMHGTPMVEEGRMTFALTGKAKAWKIAAWSWSSPPAHPAK